MPHLTNKVPLITGASRGSALDLNYRLGGGYYHSTLVLTEVPEPDTMLVLVPGVLLLLRRAHVSQR